MVDCYLLVYRLISSIWHKVRLAVNRAGHGEDLMDGSLFASNQATAGHWRHLGGTVLRAAAPTVVGRGLPRKVLVVSAGLLVLAACGASSRATSKTTPTNAPFVTAPTTHSLTGSLALGSGVYPANFTVDDSIHSRFGGDLCYGRAGYDDITEGAQVVVKDASGTIVATGSLGAGEANGTAGDIGPNGQLVPSTATTCTFPITVGSVPDSSFYSVEVSHRGAQTYSRDQLVANGWTIALSLG